MYNISKRVSWEIINILFLPTLIFFHMNAISWIIFHISKYFQLLPGVKVVIANPDTKGQCADSNLGEVNF